MKSPTRREILRGFAAAPALAALRSLARAAPILPLQYAASPFQRVNVVLHGFSAIEFAGDELRIYLPSAPGDYAFLGGTWMQEVALARGAEYRLTGVMTGPRPELRDINPERNLVYKDHAIDDTLPFCKFVLPFPDFFTPLRLLRKEHHKDFLAGSPLPVVAPNEIPQLLVLSYVHPDSTSSLEFRPLRWTPVILEGVVNFHIWDSPAKMPTLQQAAEAFAQMTKMIRSPGIDLNPAYSRIEPPLPDENPLVPGVSCSEEWTLIERLADPESCSKHRKRDLKKTPFDNLSLILY
jgi:hypothetical protein